MEFWQHQHCFHAVGEGCQLIDIIDFSLPGGGIAEALLGDWVKERLDDMFAHRHQVTRDYCNDSSERER